MADEEPLSREETLDLASQLILKSPPGQAKFVAADVQKLVEGGIPPEALTVTFRELNLTSFLVAGEAADHVVVSPAGLVSDDTFVNTKTRRLAKVDPVEQTLAEADAGPVDEAFFDASVEPHRAALVTAMAKHTELYHSRASSAGFEVYSKDGQITIISSITVLNIKNFWTGHWHSSFTLSFESDSSAKLVGESHIITHYFENGNVQMNNDRSFSGDIVFSSSESLAAEVTKAISNFHDELQGSLDEMYANIASQTLKEIRRFLPYTGKKFEWNVAAHRMRNTLRK